MKLTMLVAVASAAIGAATAVVLTDNPPPPIRYSPQLSVGLFQNAMERALESAGFGRQVRSYPHTSESTGGRRVAAPGAADRPDAEPTSGPRGVREEVLPPANPSAIESARSFKDDERARRTWLFRSEREVIGWLGTPSFVRVGTSGERWYYRRSDRTLLVAVFSRGRLLDIVG